jgi:hypothetical protein
MSQERRSRGRRLYTVKGYLFVLTAYGNTAGIANQQKFHHDCVQDTSARAPSSIL